MFAYLYSCWNGSISLLWCSIVDRNFCSKCHDWAPSFGTSKLSFCFCIVSKSTAIRPAAKRLRMVAHVTRTLWLSCEICSRAKFMTSSMLVLESMRLALVTWRKSMIRMNGLSMSIKHWSVNWAPEIKIKKLIYVFFLNLYNLQLTFLWHKLDETF